MITSFLFLLYITLRILCRGFKIIHIGALHYIGILFQDNKYNIEAQPYQGKLQNINNT